MSARRSLAIAMAALVPAIALDAWVSHCGALHGPPPCGVASLPAVPIAVVALAFDSAVAGAAATAGSARIALAVVCYALALALCAAGAWWFSSRTENRRAH